MSFNAYLFIIIFQHISTNIFFDGPFVSRFFPRSFFIFWVLVGSHFSDDHFVIVFF